MMSSSTAYSRSTTAHNDAVKMLPDKAKVFKPYHSAAHKCRCGLVFGVAAMDSYFTRKFTENLTDYLTKLPTNEKMKALMREAKMDVNFFLDLLARRSGRPFWEIHTRLSGHLDTLTTQSHSKIDPLFECFDIRNLFMSAIFKAKKHALVPSNMDHSGRFKEAVERRHKIVHGCDLNSHGNYVEIKARRIHADLALIYGLVTGANIVIDEHFKKLK